MWTVVNLVERFCDRYEFYIVTRNHDGRSDRKPYTSVNTDRWNEVGNANVFFASSRSLNTRRAAGLVNEVRPDLVFLNSVFSTPVLIFLNARRKGLISDVPVVLAPCGELSTAAMGLKSVKKKSFLRSARFFGLYRDVIWKATSELEKEEIQRQVGPAVEVAIAPDLAPKSILPRYTAEAKPTKEIGAVKLCFVSRITAKKNLVYLLERLAEIRVGRIELEIVGPIEERNYWKQCQSALERLPANVEVTILGAMPHSEILEHLLRSHFFVLPTLNENFGYVFIEALAAGCPLLISDQTVWNDIDNAGVGWAVPLPDERKWELKIYEALEMDATAYTRISRRARDYAVEWLSRPEHDEATERVLSKALARAATIRGLSVPTQILP